MIWWALHQPDFLLNTGFFSVGHPSSYKPCPTGLNFDEKQGTRSSRRGEPNPFCSWIFCFAICYDSDWRISGYINTHYHFKIANWKRKRKNIDGWPSHSSLTMSLMFKLMLTSALTREGRVSPMFGFDTLSYRRAKPKKIKQNKNRTEHRLAQFKCASCVWHEGPIKESSSPVAPPALCFYS